MIEVEIRAGALELRHAPWTRPFVGRATTRVPLGAIREVRLVERPLAEARGLRRGLVVSGRLKLGVWTGWDRVKRLVCARRAPGLRIVLDRRIAGVDELVFSVDAAGRLRAGIAGARA
ncbi:hypothetical protein HD597_009216 [Nonomuraea thailandensis]|uniref:Uncharacterized protein n=1 Tax=Nonomuraea thailandensis TaxID=1188745 RepID=A0A9X2GNH2_9ACTN|nr:hypothetical protein [Nonomuraea thailandensis]MCP2362196.1 hypothetical protein [Nonomuraea thailandensis]